MMFRCPHVIPIPGSLVLLAIEIAPCTAEDKGLLPGEEFQCELESTHPDYHYGLIRLVPDSDREVWLGWSKVEDIEFVAVYNQCDKPSEDGMMVCSLFTGHPGRCDWSLIDSQKVAMTARAAQILAYVREHGDLPPWEDFESF